MTHTTLPESHRAAIINVLHDERVSSLFHICNPEIALKTAHVDMIEPDLKTRIYYISWNAYDTPNHHTFTFRENTLTAVSSD